MTSLDKINREILLELKRHYLNNTKRIADTVPDLSIDISQLDITEESKKFLGPSVYYLHQKRYVDLKNRRVTITPEGLEELEPFFVKNKIQVFLTIFAGFLGILGTIVGVVLTLIFSK